MKLFFRYVATKKYWLGGIALCVILFAASFALYRLPLAAVLYPAALCVLMGMLFLLLDFRRVKKKHRRMQLLQELTAEMVDSLPPVETIAEEDYTKLLRKLQETGDKKQAKLYGDYREMVDYYTVWAHQIKTPIAAMKLTLQAEDSPLQRRLEHDLRRIEQYVEMVLAFLRLDSQSSDYVFRECQLDEIIRPCIRKFAPEFIDRRLTLRYEPTNETVVTDEKWLSFVVEQILSNALKYTREGGITIEMRQPHTLCIRDTGIGIAPEDLPRIFEKGYTGYNGRTDKNASGIGLYLCRRICRNLGVALTVSSVVGEGTEVCLDLAQRRGRVE